MIERITTRDGLSLVVEHHAVANPRARLVIVHGYAEHRRRYDHVVAKLRERGFECHTFDLRGHGESEGPKAHVSRFEDYLEDLDAVAKTVAKPAMLLGHSLGGLISLAYVRAHPETFTALVVSSPFLGPAFPVPKVQAIFAQLAARITPAIPIPSPLGPHWVSRDPEEVRKYASDPLVHRITTPRWFTEVTRAQAELIEHAGEIKTPTLFLLAGEDHIADHQLGRAMSEKMSFADVRIYPELYHEVFNELADDRARVLDDLTDWLEAR